MLSIFISYSTQDKELAGNLKRSFEEYDVVNCFLAHDDIAPGSQWEQEILINLEKADFFIPLQTSHLKGSYWCQQEAGFALASKIKIVPFLPDVNGVDPVGFYSKFQGFKIKTSDIRESIKYWLIKEGIISKESHDELQKRILLFSTSASFAQAGEYTSSLFELEDSFRKIDILKIAQITLDNGQISYSWAARGYLTPFFVKNSDIIPQEQLEKYLAIK